MGNTLSVDSINGLGNVTTFDNVTITGNVVVDQFTYTKRYVTHVNVTSYKVLHTDDTLVIGTILPVTLELPLATNNKYRMITIKTTGIDVLSANSDVVHPFTFALTSTIIDSAKTWCIIQSDGTRWVVIVKN